MRLPRIRLSAKGAAAVIIAWFLTVAAVGLFGEGELAEGALTILAVGGAYSLRDLLESIRSAK